MKRHRWFIGAAVAGWLVAGMVMARPGVVVTRDGTKYAGDVTEKNDSIVVTMNHVDTALPRSSVDSITYTDGFDKEFADRLAKLGPNDVAGRLNLARWAYDQHQYVKARETVDAALQIDPNSRDASNLQDLISRRIRSEATRPTTNSTPVPSTLVKAPDRLYLSEADINVIRQMELQSTDKLNVRFDNAVDRRFVQFNKLQASQFNALNPVDKALLILDKGDNTMKPDVRIMGDPMALRIYRQSIEPAILTGCAAANCHGSTKGGNFILYPRGTIDQISYTNFYILTQYAQKISNDTGGVFDSPVRHMIDRGHGARSLLVQYALPAKFADLSHPRVAGYDGIFRNMDDPKYQQFVNWMDNSMTKITPDYGIQYQPPGATSQPTTKP